MLTQATEAAIRVMTLLACEGGSREVPTPMRELGERLGGSSTYLAKTIGDLVKGGLLRSFRGAAGGVVLARSPAQISLLDIVEAVQGVLPVTYCQAVPDGEVTCGFHHAMVDVRRAILDVLSSRSLQEMASRSSAQATCKMHEVWARTR